MCCLFSFFAWTLDLIQRVITFFLACCLAFSVCCGLSVAIIAGIAYGYNYSMAEFITFTRADVTVFMRRGQFADAPDIRPKTRRFGDADDAFPSNNTDYEERPPPNPNAKPLSESWIHAQDTRRYAERLTKYIKNMDLPEKALNETDSSVEETESAEDDSNEEINQKNDKNVKESIARPIITFIPNRISITPNAIISTAVWQSGTSKIVMRNFPPVDMSGTSTVKPLDEYFHTIDMNAKAEGNYGNDDVKIDEKKVPIETPIIRLQVNNNPGRSYIPMRYFSPSTTPMFNVDPTEVDSNSIFYGR